MAHLIRMPRAAWRRQPPLSWTRINRANSLSDGLLLCALPFQRNLVNGSTAIYPANAGHKTTAIGREAASTAVANFAFYTTLPKTMLWYGTSYAANTRYIGIFSHTSEAGLYFERGSDQIKTVVLPGWGSTVLGSVAGTPICMLATSSRTNTAHDFYRDGKFVSTVTSTANLSAMTLSGALYTRGAIATPANIEGGALYATWNRVLSAAEHKELFNTPWQLFAPAPARFILIPDGAGGFTTHDVALTLAYSSVFAPSATAQFSAGITLETLAGALSGKSAQFNSALTLDTSVSTTLAKALTTLASVQMGVTTAQSASALNDAVAAITESIACSYTSSATANLLSALALGITQAMETTTGNTLAGALSLALNASAQPSATAGYAVDLTLLTAVQAALQSALATSASLTLPATLTVTWTGESLGTNDVSLALTMQTGVTTAATAILSAQLTLAAQLLATPSGIGAFGTALTLATTLSTAFVTGNAVQAALSLAVSLAMADAVAVSLGGSVQLGLVLNDLNSALAAMAASATFPVALAVPLTGGMALEAGVTLGWTLSLTPAGVFFEITVTLPTGRTVVIQASDRMVNLIASDRMVVTLP